MSLCPPVSQDEGDAAQMLCGVNATAKNIEATVKVMRQVQNIKVAKPSQDCAILPSRKAQFLRRIELMETEMGRMQKLLNELRADALHLTTE